MGIVASCERSVGASLTAISWQTEMKRAVRDPRELCRLLELPAELQTSAKGAAESFGLFVPRSFLRRMQPGNARDPLLRQVLPLADELDQQPDYTTDPVQEHAVRREAGLLQKYAGRALLVTTGACAIHCRYCFRRHYPYADHAPAPASWEPALQAIAADTSLEEIILSGGDPLTVVDSHLAWLASRLASIEHVQRLRIHTRLPIMIPQRVTDELIDWLRGTRLTPVVVIHSNHPAELDEEVHHALTRLIDNGIPVLNQAVLLRGVNDDADVLTALCRTLINWKVMPYYLHQLDRVAGAAHFDVPVDRGLELMEELRRRLPGYAVPRYVREVPGKPYKKIIGGDV